MTLGERIALARKRAGLSQEQLGEKLGVSRQAVSKWESNQSNPDVAYVAEMCRLFGVSSDWLLLGREERQESAPARCPECQAIVTGLDRFCPNCGHPLQAEADEGQETYSLVLTSRSTLYSGGALEELSRLPWCRPEFPICKKSEEELDALIRTAPVTLMWGLTGQQARQALEVFIEDDVAAIYRDSDGASAQELMHTPQVTQEELPKPPAPPHEPLSFGQTVGAVTLGILAAVLILAYL